MRLEERVKMIDVILDMGFGRRGVYSGYVFIPRYGDDQSSKVNKRNMKFKRTKLRAYDYAIDDPKYIESAELPEIDEETAAYLLRVETPASLESN